MAFVTELRDKMYEELPLSPGTVRDLVWVLSEGGAKDYEIVMQVLFESFEKAPQFEKIRESLFPVVRKNFLEFVKKYIEQDSKQTPEVIQQTSEHPKKTHEVIQQTSKVSRPPHNVTTKIVMPKVIWSRGGTGPNQNLPSKKYLLWSYGSAKSC
jgi:hypothetical protein